MLDAIRNQNHSVFGDISDMWDDYFNIRDEFSINDVLISLRKGNNRTVGTGIRITSEKEFDLQLKRYSDWIPEDYIAKIKQSVVGCPKFFKYGEVFTSISHMSYVSLFKTIEDLHRIHGLPFKNLAVCEIGAGWAGLANILIDQRAIETYWNIDLPDNLINAFCYLFANQPKKEINFVSKHRSVVPGALNFTVPAYANQAEGCFDLLVNVASFGEMPYNTARAYLKQATVLLKDGGVIFSHNGFNRGRHKELIQRPSQYGYCAFDPLEIRPIVGRGSLFGDPHVVFFGSNRPSEEDFGWKLDVIGMLFWLGLTEESTPLYSPALWCKTENEYFLGILHSFFSENDYEEKVRILGTANDVTSQFKAIANALLGLVRFLLEDSMGQQHLDQAFSELSARNSVFLSLLAHIATAKGWALMDANPRSSLQNRLINDLHLVDQLPETFSLPRIQKHVHICLNFPSFQN